MNNEVSGPTFAKRSGADLGLFLPCVGRAPSPTQFWLAWAHPIRNDRRSGGGPFKPVFGLSGAIAFQSDNSPQSWITWLFVLFGVIAIMFIIWALDRIFKPKQYKSAAGNALMTAEVFFRPSRQNVIEAKQEKKAEEDESGDPPTP